MWGVACFCVLIDTALIAVITVVSWDRLVLVYVIVLLMVCVDMVMFWLIWCCVAITSVMVMLSLYVVGCVSRFGLTLFGVI